MLKTFFAITVSGSLYEISDVFNQNGWPMVKRLAGPENPDMKIFACLMGGILVGIGDLGICLFNPTASYGRRFENMKMSNWGGSTSGIVALFLEKSSAEECWNSGDHRPYSLRYRESTLAVIEAIGQNHPVFVIGDSIRQMSFQETT